MKENFKTVNQLTVNSEQFRKFLTIAQEGKLMESQMKIVMDEMLATGKDADAIIAEKGFEAVEIDASELESIVQTVLDEHAPTVALYK
jgi:Asp-tRNA(Asn)/Glu-tRNA(Gln) amidotransferase B subunit